MLQPAYLNLGPCMAGKTRYSWMRILLHDSNMLVFRIKWMKVVDRRVRSAENSVHQEHVYACT